MVERKVSEILASRAASQPAPPSPPPQQQQQPSVSAHISEEVARRLEALERRIETSESDSKSEGLRFLLQARQAKERGDDEGALLCYESALPYFPGQAKLLAKIGRLREKIASKTASKTGDEAKTSEEAHKARKSKSKPRRPEPESEQDDGSFHGSEADAEVDDESFVSRPKKQSRKQGRKETRLPARDGDDGPPTPRTAQLLSIVNSRDVVRIRALHGFGAKKARDLVDYLELKEDDGIQTLAQLRIVPGMGGRTVERAYEGLVGV
jgi:hypothetical protein